MQAELGLQRRLKIADDFGPALLRAFGASSPGRLQSARQHEQTAGAGARYVNSHEAQVERR